MVEGARLESVYTGNRIAGSNPASSARSPSQLIDFTWLKISRRFRLTFAPRLRRPCVARSWAASRLGGVALIARAFVGEPDFHFPRDLYPSAGNFMEWSASPPALRLRCEAQTREAASPSGHGATCWK